jgi:hypothetical protein
MSKYQAGFRKDNVFYCCVASDSLYAISDIAEQRNYELRQKLADIRIGRLAIKNRFKILRKETTQRNLFK